ncbi:MAG: hypothetical protein QF879_06765 [Candidatus Latescibacteria bacterium]|jgi:hypothetical protein|nr:hypothetical protein [Candidatus Latescibacterota bacterium]MDP7235572.1 hypothetical protein [Candidatus Latescibacterota bacterium]
MDNEQAFEFSFQALFQLFVLGGPGHATAFGALPRNSGSMEI